jgi:hypothetical protein
VLLFPVLLLVVVIVSQKMQDGKCEVAVFRSGTKALEHDRVKDTDLNSWLR